MSPVIEFVFGKSKITARAWLSPHNEETVLGPRSLKKRGDRHRPRAFEASVAYGNWQAVLMKCLQHASALFIFSLGGKQTSPLDDNRPSAAQHSFSRRLRMDGPQTEFISGSAAMFRMAP